ncbi:MAG TPA: pyrroloquinoline quinone biosynthesis protein PqqE [Terriglobales bacterium]
MSTLSNPLALIAEITHRCPLHCVYCSNPLEMIAAKSELATADWTRVFSQAASMGVLHVHLTGGEPLARNDLTELIKSAHRAGLYINLITSGIGLSRERLQALVDAGLDHIQLSFQDSAEEPANQIAGTKAHAHKIELAEWIREHRIAFTTNLVIHRQNMNHLAEMIAFLETLGPNRMEIASAQYYGWALKNRSSLMPTREQVENAIEVVADAEKKLKGKIRIDFVVPDYYARYPKACMGGWGQKSILIDPAGRALPCHAAGVIPGLAFDNVREHALDWVWRESAAFKKFRGESWMPEPCRSCDRRAEDFGGCRCQAFLLTGDAAATDPACSLAPQHFVIEAALRSTTPEVPAAAGATLNWEYRPNPK